MRRRYQLTCIFRVATEWGDFRLGNRGHHPRPSRRGSDPRTTPRLRRHRSSIIGSDQTTTADVVIAYTTLSGLSLGQWFNRLFLFTPITDGSLFSTEQQNSWTSQYFRNNYAYPILEMQRLAGEPSLSTFSSVPGKHIADKIYSMHSWRRGGRSRVSRAPRHNEPNPRGTRKATPNEVYEHGRW
jgi:hypothetical protein